MVPTHTQPHHSPKTLLLSMPYSKYLAPMYTGRPTRSYGVHAYISYPQTLYHRPTPPAKHNCHRLHASTLYNTCTKMHSNQAVPLHKRGSARHRNRVNRATHLAVTNPTATPALPQSGDAAAPPAPPPLQPQGTSTLSLFHARIHNSPLILYYSPTYPDRISREEAFFDPELPI